MSSRQTPNPPRFASPVTLLKRLAFTGGRTLLHSIQQQVFVWDVRNARLRGAVRGELFGVANDGNTFITRLVDQAWIERDIQARSGFGRQRFLTDAVPVPRFMLWDTARGSQLKFTGVEPDVYSPHQRFHGLADRYNQMVRLDDVFRVIPSRILDLQPATHEAGILENWMITPDDQHLAVIYYVSGGGFDWNGGVCVRLEDGKTAYRFDGGRDDFPPYLYFSPENRWLMSPVDSKVNVYDVSTGTQLNTIPACASVMSAHRNGLLAEVNGTRSAVRLRSITQPEVTLWEAHFTPKVLDVEFHPDGEWLAVSLTGGDIELRNVKTGRLLNRYRGS